MLLDLYSSMHRAESNPRQWPRRTEAIPSISAWPTPLMHRVMKISDWNIMARFQSVSFATMCGQFYLKNLAKWYPQPDSNRRQKSENLLSWASRRWGHVSFHNVVFYDNLNIELYICLFLLKYFLYCVQNESSHLYLHLF